MKFRKYLGYRSRPIDRLACADLPPGRRFGATRGRLRITKHCKAIQALDLNKDASKYPSGKTYRSVQLHNRPKAQSIRECLL